MKKRRSGSICYDLSYSRLTCCTHWSTAGMDLVDRLSRYYGSIANHAIVDLDLYGHLAILCF